MEEGTTVTVRIKESVKAGVVAYLEGIRAFIPASQITSAYVEDTESWVGKEIPVRPHPGKRNCPLKYTDGPGFSVFLRVFLYKQTFLRYNTMANEI